MSPREPRVWPSLALRGRRYAPSEPRRRRWRPMARVMQDYRRASRVGWAATMVVALAAEIVALLLQQAIRALWQARTLPERTMEYALPSVSPSLFEQGPRQFGTDAKAIALVAAVGGMATIRSALGALALR